MLRDDREPMLTLNRHVAAAINYALRVYIDEEFVDWAEGWLTGRDRSEHAAYAVLRSLLDMVAANDVEEAAIDAAREARAAAEYLANMHITAKLIASTPQIVKEYVAKAEGEGRA